MAPTAVIAGVGPGLGESIARTFADEGCEVGLFARSGDYVSDLADDLPTDAVGVETDVSDPDDVKRGFERVRDELGPVDVLVNHASGGAWEGLRNLSAEEFEQAWRVGGYGAFLCAKEAVPDMLDGDGGTVIFTGATSAIRGREGALGFSSAKFAARGMAESMARELGPEGIHVAHVVIDGQILTPSARESNPDRDEETFLDPDEIAENYWHLVEQDRSAWTLELDLRPHTERF
ncbi:MULTISPECIES: SDR family NAD(P)-dependent oxidoreductase [Halorussus]|uniref:SDR family NAD(P)-dependent oxidoreductase n=1 Tax=Halorussus TaxID=1070314 RepID=UPI00209FB5A6|nr:SDR family NAD(P)-dependent oxidoreductase [Halorussus vallis]USZ73891.1 SDR family NAD(P)-dependent oxidoreductase [Halorussus vallis]